MPSHPDRVRRNYAPTLAEWLEGQVAAGRQATGSFEPPPLERYDVVYLPNLVSLRFCAKCFRVVGSMDAYCQTCLEPTKEG